MKAPETEPATSNAVEDKPEGLTMLLRCRNHRAFLPLALRGAMDALDSLEKRGFPAEVLVLDDDSQDGSQKLLRSIQALYDEPRLRSKCLGERAGPTKLRDVGMRSAGYRYVCVMDADVEVVPDNLPLLVQSIADTGAAMVYGNILELKDERVSDILSNMPVVSGLAKSRRLGACFVLDARKASGLEAAGEKDSAGPEGWDAALQLLSEGEAVVFVPVVAGYLLTRSMSAGRKLRLSNDGPGASRRTKSVEEEQRQALPPGRTYHPDVGFLDE